MRLFLTAITIISLLIYPVITLATVADDLQNQIDQKEAQIQALEKQIAEYQAIVKNSQSQGATLKLQISKMETQIKKLESEVKLTQTQISQTNLKIQGLTSDIQTQSIALEKQKTDLGQIIRTINEYDQEDPFSLVLKNDNFSDFLNQVQYIDSLQNNVQSKLLEIKDFKSQMEVQKTDYEQQKNQLQDLNSQLKGKSLALDDQKDQKQNLLTTTKNQEKQYQNMVSDLQKKRDQIETEIYQIEEKLRLEIDPSSIPTARHGLFAWPVKSQSITQNFGCVLTTFAKRSYPACTENNKSGGFHNGIDIDTDTGDAVYAVLDGTISGVGNLGKYAYGKWITINLNNGLTVLYGHLAAQSVSVGQHVKMGDIIGYSDSTGYSTGPHLHFSVYATNTFEIQQKSYGPLPVGGPVSPLNYL